MPESEGSNIDVNNGASDTVFGAGSHEGYANPKHAGGYRSGPAPTACGTCSQPESRH
jgi:hypothetical protein